MDIGDDVLMTLVETVTRAVRQHCAVDIAAMQARIDLLEKLELARDDKVTKGWQEQLQGVRQEIDAIRGRKSLDLADVDTFVVTKIADAIKAMPLPQDGTDGVDGSSVTVADVEPLIAAEVTKAVAAIPAPERGVPGQDGRDGQSVTVDELRPVVIAEVAKAVELIDIPQPAPGVDGKDGQSVTVEDIAPLILAEVQKAVAELPVPQAGERGTDGQDGQSVTVDDVAPFIAAEVQKAVAAIPPARDGNDGRSVDPEAVEVMVLAHVTKAVAELPPPDAGKDGRSVTVDDVRPLIDEAVTKAVQALPVPKDGVGLADALIDRSGHLVATLTDGRTKELGRVIAHDVDMDAVKSLVVDELSKWPRPQDGKDGVGFDDFEEIYDGERTIIHRYVSGDRVKEFTHILPIVVYRGVFVAGKGYQKGDAVTWAGSYWVAKSDTSAKPGENNEASRAWVLAVKKGSDGKAIVGPVGPVGPRGERGEMGPRAY